MSGDRWLAVLIRARKAREDVARAEAARATAREAESLRAAAALHRAATAAEPPAEHAPAFAASAAAKAAAAHLLSAAVAAWRADLARSAEANAVVTRYASARRSVEKLAERRDREREAHRTRAEQAQLDEIAARQSREDGQ